MRQLLLLRHARPVMGVETSDWERPLTPIGAEDAQAAGRVLSDYTIDIAMVSTSQRTRETWENAEMGGAEAGRVEWADWVYTATGRELAYYVAELPNDASTVLIVGHMPSLAEAVAEIASPDEKTGTLSAGLSHTALVVLEYDSTWDMMPGRARLVSHQIIRA